MHTTTVKPKLSHGSQTAFEETFLANLVGSWSELSLMEHWKRISKKSRRKVKTLPHNIAWGKKIKKEIYKYEVEWRRLHHRTKKQSCSLCDHANKVPNFSNRSGRRKKDILYTMLVWLILISAMLTQSGLLKFKNENIYSSTCKGVLTGQSAHNIDVQIWKNKQLKTWAIEIIKCNQRIASILFDFACVT